LRIVRKTKREGGKGGDRKREREKEGEREREMGK
jgi:hypothetical protein